MASRRLFDGAQIELGILPIVGADATSQSANLTGDGSVAGTLTATVSLQASLVGDGGLVGTLIAKGELLADLTGDGTLSGTISSAGAGQSANLTGDGSLSGTLTATVELQASLVGDGSLAGTLTAKGELLADLTGDGSLTGLLGTAGAGQSADLTGAGSLVGTLIASALLQASLVGDGSVVGTLSVAGTGQSANLSGAGSVTANLTAVASMTANINCESELSPLNLAAAVWNAVSTQYNVVGTMGNKLNAAGAAADPWTTVLDGSYSAGDLMRLMSAALAGELAGAPAGPILIKSVDGATLRITATVDANGNRTGLIYNVS